MANPSTSTPWTHGLETCSQRSGRFEGKDLLMLRDEGCTQRHRVESSHRLQPATTTVWEKIKIFNKSHGRRFEGVNQAGKRSSSWMLEPNWMLSFCLRSRHTNGFTSNQQTLNRCVSSGLIFWGSSAPVRLDCFLITDLYGENTTGFIKVSFRLLTNGNVHGETDENRSSKWSTGSWIY